MLYLNVLGLSGLADDLHDEMPLCILLEVSPGELQRVEERVSGGQLHVVAGLVPPHPVHNRRQDLVRLRLQAPRVHILGQKIY